MLFRQAAADADHQSVLAPAAVTAPVEVIGADAVLFAVDYPYESTRAAVAALEDAAIARSDKDEIAFGERPRPATSVS